MGPCSMYSVVVVSEYLGGCDGVLYDPELCNENILSTASLSIEVFVAACIAAAGPVDNQVVSNIRRKIGGGFCLEKILDRWHYYFVFSIFFSAYFSICFPDSF